jgi:hypothetical protein
MPTARDTRIRARKAFSLKIIIKSSRSTTPKATMISGI